MTRITCVLACALLFSAPTIRAGQASQPPSGDADKPAVISGMVVDIGTGAPLAEVRVVARADGQSARAQTDSGGRYSLPDLKPGRYIIEAQASGLVNNFGSGGTRAIMVAAGQKVEGFNLRVTMYGEISGRVLDENKEPVPASTVFLVAREYHQGQLRYMYAGFGKSDDEGNYRLEHVPAGRGFFVAVTRGGFKMKPVSDIPADPKLRRRTPVLTFYPGSPTVEGLTPLVLRAGEHRDNADIFVARTPSYCVSGIISGSGGQLHFGMEPIWPASGRVGNGAAYFTPRNGIVGPDGKIRLCNLGPGDYRLIVWQSAEKQGSAPAGFATSLIAISDRDVSDLVLGTIPPVPLSGDLVWDGEAPDPPVSSKLRIRIDPFNRSPWMHEQIFTESTLPGQFSFPGMLIDDYILEVHGVPDDAYIKDVTYAGNSIQYKTFRPGSAPGTGGLRIVLARDGAKIAVKLTDKDNNPVADSHVFIIPAGVGSEAELPERIIEGQADQAGSYTSRVLAPGKYLVLASEQAFDRTPETVGRVWNSRSRAKELELEAGKNASITIEVGQ